jgi:hypothetical protein
VDHAAKKASSLYRRVNRHNGAHVVVGRMLIQVLMWAYPKPWTDEIVRAADVVITMAAATPVRSCRASGMRTGPSTTLQARLLVNLPLSASSGHSDERVREGHRGSSANARSSGMFVTTTAR